MVQILLILPSDMSIDRLRNFLSHTMAIDLGTANTLVFVHGVGLVLQEPSVLAVRRNGKSEKIIAVGQKAKDMLGKTPHMIEAIRPIKDGVISDFIHTGVMLRYFIEKAQRHFSLFRARLIIGVPFGVTKVEQRAVRESALSAGAGEVHLVADPMASAIGAGLPVGDAIGSMIVDIGSGTTEVAVISLGDIIVSQSIQMAGNKMDDAISHYIKHKYNLLIGDATAESVKIEIGCCSPGTHARKMRIRGLDLMSRLPASVEITAKEVAEAISEPVRAIINVIKATLEQTPPELSADIIDSGITLTGGGSLLNGLDALIHQETGLQVKYAENPMSTVAMGSGKMLDSFDILPDEVVM